MTRRLGAGLLLTAWLAAPASAQVLRRFFSVPKRQVATSQVATSTQAAGFSIFSDTQTKAEVSQAARNMLVGVGLAFKPLDPESPLDPDYFYSFGDSWSVKSHVQQEQRLWLLGVRTDAEGSLVAKAAEYNWDAIESIELFTADGSTASAAISGISKKGGLVWLKAEGLPAIELPQPSTQSVQVGAWYFCASAGDFETEPTYRVHECSPSERTWFSPKKLLRRLEEYSMSGALFDAKGKWIGVDPEHDQIDSSGTWKASLADLKADFLSREEFNAARERAGQQLLRRLLPVRLRFQKKAADPAGGYFASLLSDDGDVDLKERVDVALPVRGGLLLIPQPLDRKLIQRLESVTVLAGGHEAAGRFVGPLREFGGYLVEVEGSLEDAAPGGFAPAPGDDELSLAVVPRYRGGALEYTGHHEYLSGVLRGYKDVLWRKALYTRRRGSVLATLEGRPFAVMLEQKRYDKEPEKSRYDEPAPIMVPFELAQLSAYLADPASQVDLLVKPQLATGAGQKKRKPWLGVETQNIGKDWAELRGAQRETRDGTIGQLVTLVYPGSPAERAGLKAGDLLLKARESRKKDEVLIPADISPSASYSMDFGARGTMVKWFKRKRPISEFMDRFNAGAKLRLAYARAHREKTVEVELEESPEDLETSAKLRHEKTGLVLKPLPYDMRRLLRLGPEVAAVVVYEVDSGSPASVAGVQPLDLILDVDDRATGTLDEFSRAADAALDRKELRVRTRFLDTTRVVTLKLQ